jgi:thymidylate kinase
MRRRTTVALSGVVGSGKSSAAKLVVQELRAAGCEAEHVRFQDFTGSRSSAKATESTTESRRQEQKDAGQRWAGYARRPLTIPTAAGYVFRTVLFRRRLQRLPAETIVVFDRYFYDSLVHFDLNSAGLPLQLLVKAIPEPTVAALLLVQERTILERRNRYAEEYARQVAEAYEELPRRFPGLLVARTDEFHCVKDLADRIVADVLTKRDADDVRTRS